MADYHKFKPIKWHPYQIKTQRVLCHDGTELPMTVVGNGKPVVLLHAFGMDARQFLPFVLPFANRFCFYLLHFRGYGLASHLATTQFDFIEQYADDVEAILADVCQRHQVAAVPVGAISMGALVVWAYLSRYLNPSFDTNNMRTNAAHQTPDKLVSKTGSHKISQYLNIDQVPAVHHQPDWQGGVFGDHQADVFKQFRDVLADVLPYINASKKNHRNDLPFVHLPYAIKRKVVDTERDFAMLAVSRKHTQWLARVGRYQTPYKLGLYNDDTWQQKMRCLQAYVELPYDYRLGIENLNIPVTLLIGGKSQLYSPKWQRAIADKLTKVKVIELPQSGHAVPLDAPIHFARILKQFLES